MKDLYIDEDSNYSYRNFKKDFLDDLKSFSMIQFRNNANKFLKEHHDSIYEKKIDEYEEGLISNFNIESKMFIQYQYLLDHLDLLFNLGKKDLNNFFMDYITVNKLKELVHEDKQGNILVKNSNELVKYLKKISKIKLNEVVVDRLFKDNIYNVFLNIREMLTFHNQLVKDEKVLSQEQIKFYETILNIDSCDVQYVLEFYFKFKEEDIASLFYYDLKNVKHKSYDKIRECLFRPEENIGHEDQNLSKEYGVPVFDLRDKEYFILARCLDDSSQEQTNHLRDCYTLLSNDNSSIMHDDAYIYGYSGFDNNSILHVFESDSFSNDTNDRDLLPSTPKINRIMTPKEIVTKSPVYSEIQIVNKNRGNDLFETLRPSYLVVFDKIEDKMLEEAKRKNIPICIISHALNIELPRKNSYDYVLDNYTSPIFESSEEVRRNKRLN